jgi:threonine dehydratase
MASLMYESHVRVLNVKLIGVQYLRLILTSRVYEVVTETPLTYATNLSNRLGCNVLLKREDLQPVFSFKLRGAYNKMAHLSKNDRWKGVVACSAGRFLSSQ